MNGVISQSLKMLKYVKSEKELLSHQYGFLKWLNSWNSQNLEIVSW